MQRLTKAAKEIDEQQSQIFRLEVRLAEANKKLEHTADLEKELLHYRCCITCVSSDACPSLSVNHIHPFQEGTINSIASHLNPDGGSSCASTADQHQSSFVLHLGYLFASWLSFLSRAAPCRKFAKDAEKKGQGGLWGYISGS